MYEDLDKSDLDITIMWFVNLICVILSFVSFLQGHNCTRYQIQGPQFQNNCVGAILVPSLPDLQKIKKK